MQICYLLTNLFDILLSLQNCIRICFLHRNEFTSLTARYIKCFCALKHTELCSVNRSVYRSALCPVTNTISFVKNAVRFVCNLPQLVLRKTMPTNFFVHGGVYQFDTYFFESNADHFDTQVLYMAISTIKNV